MATNARGAAEKCPSVYRLRHSSEIRLTTAAAALNLESMAAHHGIANAFPLGPPISSALIKGASPYIQYAFYCDDATPSAALVASFKAAYTRAAAASGLTPAQALAEQDLFDFPTMWKIGSPPVGKVMMKLQHCLLSNALRFAVTALPEEQVLLVLRCAKQIRSHSPEQSIDDSLNALLDGLPPGSAFQELLGFALNVPSRCNGWVYSLASDVALPVALGLDLDMAEVEKCLTSYVAIPTEAQLSVSRTVCVWCHAPPVGRGVQLFECKRCGKLAYCSALCAASDWGAHQLECGSADPKLEVGITRSFTEVALRPCRRTGICNYKEKCRGLQLLIMTANGDMPANFVEVPNSFEVRGGPGEQEAGEDDAATACATCHAAPSPGQRLQVCAGCRRVHYCSKQCQVRHWKHGHKAQCQTPAN